MAKSLYIKLSDQLIDKITNEMEVGDLLPSERKLAEMYEVSRTTVRLALNYLENRGYISIQHGKGSSVLDRNQSLINLSNMYSFTDQMLSIGKTPQTKLLSLTIIDNSKYFRNIFSKQEDKLIKLVRLRSADGIPMIYEESFIPYSKFKGISEYDLNQRPLYDIFLDDYGEVIKLAHEEFSAEIANKSAAKHLNLVEQSPVLNIVRTTYSSKDEVIEYTESKARPDKFSYRTVHHNQLAY